jgi:hypothetical protein
LPSTICDSFTVFPGFSVYVEEKLIMPLADANKFPTPAAPAISKVTVKPLTEDEIFYIKTQEFKASKILISHVGEVLCQPYTTPLCINFSNFFLDRGPAEFTPQH